MANNDAIISTQKWINNGCHGNAHAWQMLYHNLRPAGMEPTGLKEVI